MAKQDYDYDAEVGKQIIEEVLNTWNDKKSEVSIAEFKVSDDETVLEVLYDVVIEDDSLRNDDFEEEICWHLRDKMSKFAEHYKQVIGSATYAVSDTCFLMTAVEPLTHKITKDTYKPKVHQYAEATIRRF